jgi:hypothetical protein
MMNISSYKYILGAAMLLLLGSCAKEKDLPVPEPETRNTIHYSLTVEQGSDTRSTLGPGYEHLFEAGDRIYVESTGDDAGKMYGFLSMSISAGVGQSTASFEGDLTSVGEFVPTADTPISLTLVGPADELHTYNDDEKKEKVTGVDYSDKYAESIEEAVRRFADFTGSGKFGDYRYTLQQNSSFLVCALSFDAATTPITTSITAKIYNNSETDPIYTYTANPKDVDGDIEVSWVIPFNPTEVTSFTDAKMTVIQEGKADVNLKMADANFAANKYYTFQRTTYLQNYFTIEATKANTTFTFNYSEANDGLQYSRDGFEWFNYKTTDDPLTLDNVGDYIYFRGKRLSYQNDGKTNKPLITVDGDNPCYVYGDIMFLMCDAKFKPRTSMANFAFQGLFKNCTWLRLRDDKKLILSAKTLSKGCYADMFSGCTGLTSLTGLGFPTVDIPLAPRCFDSMFLGTGISKIPEGFLPWTKLEFACYRKMFDSCTSLKDVPSNLLPAMNLEKACYLRMFFGCSKLEVAPELPATEPAVACYFAIFRNCTSIRYVKCLMLLTEAQRIVYANPNDKVYDNTADPPADNLEIWDMISTWSVFNKWLVTTNNQPLNNKSTSVFVRNPDMEYWRKNDPPGYSSVNWMGVVPSNWTMKNDGEE